MHSGSQRELKENQRVHLRASSEDTEATLFCFGKEVSSRLIIALQEKEHQVFLKVKLLQVRGKSLHDKRVYIYIKKSMDQAQT